MRKVVVAAAIALAGCDQGPTGPTVDVPVTGRVLDYATNVGVPNVAVAFGDSATVTGPDGSYGLVIPSVGRFEAIVEGRSIGVARVTGSGYRGDFLVHWGTCVGRYGTVTDARTLRPISEASVELSGKGAVTAVDGWYRLDLGCPTGTIPGLLGINTTFINVAHPNYVPVSNVAGKGVSGVYRADFALQRR
jgi:hypothetical protein